MAVGADFEVERALSAVLNPLGTITDQKQLEERIAGSVVVEE